MIAWFRSCFLHKCPRCLEGDIFPDKNSYHLRQTTVQNMRCPSCDLNLWPEPGFFYGAMYVSYAFTIALGVAVFILHYLVHKHIQVWWFLFELSLALLLTAPYTFRTSRAIWLNFFNRYNPAVREAVLKAKNSAV